jgi:YggT family protein
MNALKNTSVFLIQILFNLYLLILLARIILQRVGANYYNPFVQLIVRLTNFIVIPLRRVIPEHFGIDFAAILLLFIIEIIKLILLSSLLLGGIPHVAVLVLWAIVDLMSLLINIFFYAIILAVIFSWIGGMASGPFIDILHLISEPLLRPARRLIPPIAGFDISPIPILILLKLLNMLLWQGFLSIMSQAMVSGMT